MNTINVLGVNISNIDMEGAVTWARDALEDKAKRSVFTPNPEIIFAAQKNERLAKALVQADLLLPDGIGVVIASRMLGEPLKERVAGFDFAHRLIELSVKLNKKIFLFGAKAGVAERARDNLISRYEGVEIVGVRNGYFGADDEKEIINEINSSGADILLVCLGAPKQEIWINENRDKLNPVVCIGVGGALDVMAGDVSRAPRLIQNMGLEWLYRAVKQPQRFPRLLVLPAFLVKVAANAPKAALRK